MKMKSSGKQVQTYQYLKSIPNEIIPNKYSHCAKVKNALPVVHQIYQELPPASSHEKRNTRVRRHILL